MLDVRQRSNYEHTETSRTAGICRRARSMCPGISRWLDRILLSPEILQRESEFEQPDQAMRLVPQRQLNAMTTGGLSSTFMHAIFGN